MTRASTVALALERGILKRVSRELLRVHDLILSVAVARTNEDLSARSLAETKFWNYLAEHLIRPPYHFTRTVHVHRRTIETVALGSLAPGVATRVYFKLEEAAFQTGFVDALRKKSIDPVNWAATTSVIEAMEASARTNRIPDSRNRYLQECASVLEEAVSEAADAPDVQLALLHHAGKFRAWAGDRKHAMQHFEQVLARDPAFMAARLQVARLVGSIDEPRAVAELRMILELALNPRTLQSSSVTLLLAAFEEVTNKPFASLLPEFVLTDTSYFRSVIELAVADGYGQPYVTVARMVERIGYADPQLALQLLQDINLPEPALDDDRSNLGVGRIEIARHDALKRIHSGTAESNAAIEKALGYLHRIKNWQDADEMRDLAKALHRLERYSEALDVLKAIPENVASAFVYYDTAKACRMLGRFDEGAHVIEEGIRRLGRAATKFLPTFLRLQAFLRADIGDVAQAVLLLEQAVARLADGDRFRTQITSELEELQRTKSAPASV